MLYVFTANRTKQSITEIGTNLDFVKFFSLDKACAAMLYVFTATRTKRSLAEKSAKS